MKIKVVCERTGLTDRTIRYYIEEGLLSPSFKENHVGRKSFDFTEDDIVELNNIAVLRSFDFSVEEIRQILKDPQSSPSIIKIVKERVCGELTTSQKKTSLLSSLQEETAYTVCELAKQLSAPQEITQAHRKIKSSLKLKVAIALAGVFLLVGVLVVIFVCLNKTCEHRDADDNALCDACGESFTDATEHAIGFKTFAVNGTTAYIKVSSTTTRFSFLDEISVLGNATFQVFRDLACKELIESKVSNLVSGDNIFYVLEQTGGERNTLYTVTVRRKPMYTVTFDTADGTAIMPQTVEEDGLVTAPEAPERTGYVFLNWSHDFTRPVTENITIKANWQGKSYAVSYNANGGTVDATSAFLTCGQSYTLKAPQRTGYTFEGWYCGENRIELTGTWEVAENVTLIAHWIPHINTPYRVEHYIERLDGTYELRETDNLTGTSDAVVTPITKYYEGFASPLWQSVTVLSDGTRVVRYEYRRSSYTVTFVTNGGEGVATQSLKYGTSLPGATRAEYTFGGWFSDVELATAVTTVPAQNITLYAWWAEETKPGAFSCSGTYEITITDFIIDDSAVYIPAFIGGKPVTCIGDGAFQYCNSLHAITLPAGVTNISNSAFNCNNFVSITVKEGNAVYHSKGNCLIETATNTLLLGCKNSIIPDYVTSIGNYAFAYSNITSITLPAGLTNIGDYAFYGCDFTLITIPNGVTSIGDFAFNNCSSLTSITLPDGLTRIGNSVFLGCGGLTSIKIPTGVTSVGNSAFSNCSRLTSITLPTGVMSIGDRAFYNCSNLASITLPDSLTSIGQYAFYCCYDLASITIPVGVTCIAEGAFNTCFSLVSVAVPNGVTSIGESAFYNCIKLVSVTLPDSLTNISDYAFYNCSSLASITLPDGLTGIGKSVFYNCTDLLLIALPAGLTGIGDRAFYNCSNLASITIPNGVTDIGDAAFYDCSSFTSITLPDGLTRIGRNVFSGCSGLTSIKIPVGVTSIGVQAFAYCERLTSITLPDGLIDIGGSAFLSCYGLKSITIPASVSVIDGSAFAYCISLETVTIPAGVISIGRDAFTGCGSLTSLTIPLWYLPQYFQISFRASDVHFCCLYEYDGVGKPSGLSDFEKTQQFGGWYADAALTVLFDFDAWLAGERTVGDTLILYTKASAS
ncbi:MAG: leucine-rich repeat protein [Clostridia bacterium]|nr:leucine-rich repeat protein [Clostridia bacterium]